MPPRWIIYLAIIAVVASWVPFAVVALARSSLSELPPLHLFLDMDDQVSLKAQERTLIFADQRAMRPRIGGTVPRGELRADDHYYRGYETNAAGEPITIQTEGGQIDRKWIAGFPEQVTVDLELLRRGRERYNIHCAACHGMSGQGDGMTHQRAAALETAGWVQPSNLVSVDAQGRSTYGPELYPEGRMLNTISHGVRTMPGYASQIDVRDRWAIIAYIHALQLSQNARIEDVPMEKRDTLR